MSTGLKFETPKSAINCVKYWKLKRTGFGSCLEIQPNEIYQIKLNKYKSKPKKAGFLEDIVASFKQFPKASEIKELDFVVGYNKSDRTFGLNGFRNALKLYYADYDEKFMSKSHSVELVSSLSPTITFSRTVTKLLGKPFTECRKSKIAVGHGHNYTQRTCQVHEYMAEVIGTCGCYPR